MDPEFPVGLFSKGGPGRRRLPLGEVVDRLTETPPALPADTPDLEGGSRRLLPRILCAPGMRGGAPVTGDQPPEGGGGDWAQTQHDPAADVSSLPNTCLLG